MLWYRRSPWINLYNPCIVLLLYHYRIAIDPNKMFSLPLSLSLRRCNNR